jgi:PKD repeat protein
MKFNIAQALVFGSIFFITQAVQAGCGRTVHLDTGNGYSAPSQGDGWSNAWYPPEHEGTPTDDTYAQRAKDHPVDIHISRVDVRHSENQEWDQDYPLDDLTPGEKEYVRIKVKVQNRSDHNFWYVRHEVCVNNTRRFKHDERRVVEFEDLDEDALEDLGPGERSSEKGFRKVYISLSEDAKSIKVKARDGYAQTFSVTEEDIARGEAHLYFWLDTYALGYANQTDRDTSSKGGNEYATVNVKLPWVKSKFVMSTVTGEAPLLVNFEDASTGSSGAIASREYIFGDGAVSSLANTQHIYTEPGNYDVEFKVTSSWGEVKTAVIPIVVTAPVVNGLVNTYFASTDFNSPKVVTEVFTEGRCFTGTPTTLLGMGVIGNPWEWTCQGEDGGTSEVGYAILEEENNYSNLTLATGTAIGYGDGTVEGQTDSFNVGDTIYFGVFADVDVSHAWRIEVYQNGSLWWGQDSNSRDSLDHSFYSLNQEATVSGDYTFKVFLGGEFVDEKSVVVGEDSGGSNPDPEPDPNTDPDTDNYFNLTLATGTAIGYGDGTVEGQTDSFNINDTICFGVFAGVDTAHQWRIEAYHNDDFWWGQDSDQRESSNHSFHSLNQEVTTSGTFTFKVFLDTGDGLAPIAEKSIVIP